MTTPQMVGLFFATALTIWWFSSVAGRLDRVHIRRDQAFSSLELQLARRTASVTRVLTLGLLDPVSANVLARQVEFVTVAADRSAMEHFAAESELTRALAAIFDDPDDMVEFTETTESAFFFSELAQSCRRVQLARRFHNDAVGAAQLLRRRSVVRWFRLAGRTEMPVAIDLDDTIPTGLENFS